MINPNVADELYEKAKQFGFNRLSFEIEAALILAALKESNYLRAGAAKLLKLNRSTLSEKVRKLRDIGFSIPAGVAHRPLNKGTVKAYYPNE